MTLRSRAAKNTLDESCVRSHPLPYAHINLKLKRAERIGNQALPPPVFRGQCKSISGRSQDHHTVRGALKYSEKVVVTGEQALRTSGLRCYDVGVGYASMPKADDPPAVQISVPASTHEVLLYPPTYCRQEH